MRAARQLRSMDLILPLAFRATMRDAAHATPDREICGLLLGEGLRVTNILPAANSAPDPATGFEIDPAILITAHKTARAGGPAIIGCYHSHPNGKAEPSPRDAEAAEPGSVWVIVANGQISAWRYRADRFESLAILPS